MSETDPKEAACREIAERYGLTITHITDDDFEPRVVKNPDPDALAALREAYDAGAKAQREEDAEIAMAALKEAEAIRQGRQ